ncbi:TPM domain-containing protein [Tellurirhabdus rosea]|uniref:TPM domain-containing protein n=1 Tax=Tellurirhabdus rosea TaxID=2674997 RepID=UPI00224D539B|nr:TPM domain-containing protein [Tellurirhabdus rosea]
MNSFLKTVRPVLFLSGLVLFLFMIGLPVRAQDTGTQNVIPDRPNPPRLVNDLAGILRPDEVQRLEDKLRRYNDTTSTQIVVLIVRSTEPYPIGDFSFQVGRKWGVGQKGKNNGLILAWSTQDRKVFIATGYGLEGAIPDAIAKRIISDIISPRFKNEEWYAGLDEATNEIIRRANGEYKSQGGDSDGGSNLLPILLVFFFVILILIWIGRNRGGGNRYRSGGPTIFPFPYTTYSGWGGSSGNWGGGGSGGGSDFGGFGGGDFGGGGAGGDY